MGWFLVVLLLAMGIRCSERPIIGVFSQPDYSKEGYSYIAASYVKWIESAGGKVVPILFDYEEEKLKWLFERLNGVIFPGGGTSLKFDSQFMKALKVFYELSLSSKDDYFPVWGTCLGFEALVVLSSEDDTILDGGFDSYGVSLPLFFQQQHSRMYDFCGETCIHTFQTENVTLNNHHSGISSSHWNTTKKLKDFYSLVTTNFDLKGREFVSSIESKEFPVYGVQYHPEKVQFEDRPEAINHSLSSTIANSMLSFFFVDECRKSDHYFDEEEAEEYYIYNYNPVYTFKTGDEFAQRYYFKYLR